MGVLLNLYGWFNGYGILYKNYEIICVLIIRS